MSHIWQRCIVGNVGTRFSKVRRTCRMKLGVFLGLLHQFSNCPKWVQHCYMWLLTAFQSMVPTLPTMHWSHRGNWSFTVWNAWIVVQNIFNRMRRKNKEICFVLKRYPHELPRLHISKPKTFFFIDLFFSLTKISLQRPSLVSDLSLHF